MATTTISTKFKIVIQKEVRDVLTDQILFGALEHGGTVTIDVAGNRLTFTYDSGQGS